MSQSLRDTYRRLRNSIVAFVPVYRPLGMKAPEPGALPEFPPIIGTGFVVHEAGLIATNNHVLNAFRTVQQHPDNDRFPIDAIILAVTDRGVLQLRMEVDGIFKQTNFKSEGVYYSRDWPDIGFVAVKSKGLCPVNLATTDYLYEEGELVATAGFPMGLNKMQAPGWMNQVSPTLQTGVISDVHPFPCRTAHGFTINCMVQGGASGSPVFEPTTGIVIGAVYASLNEDMRVEHEGFALNYKVPTTFGYAVASHFIVRAMELVFESPGYQALLPKMESIHDRAARAGGLNMLDGESVEGGFKLPW